MTISAALQGVIILQVVSQTVSQFPVSFPFPGASPQMLPNMPPQPFLPGGLGPVPMGFPVQQKMPMVVMPYYSKSADKAQKKLKRKKRRPKKIHFDESSCEDDDSGSSEEYNFRTKVKSKRRQVLTPVVSYVTKDGYVVYQKKIKKDRARDWLEMGKRKRESQENDDIEDDRQELLRKLNKLKFSKKHRKDRYQKY